MARVSKAELEARLEASEAQVASLRDELAQAALHIGDLEDKSQEPDENEGADMEDDLVYFENLSECQRMQIEGLAKSLATSAEMLLYAFTIATSILAYRGENPDRPRELAASITEELDGFAQKYVDGDFDYDTIIGAVLAEQEAVAIASNVDPGTDVVDFAFTGDDELNKILSNIEVYFQEVDAADSPGASNRFGDIEEILGSLPSDAEG